MAFSCDADLIRFSQQGCGRPCQNPVRKAQELIHLGTSKNNYVCEDTDHQLLPQQLQITSGWGRGLWGVGIAARDGDTPSLRLRLVNMWNFFSLEWC